MKTAEQFTPFFRDAKAWAVLCVFALFAFALLFFSRFDMRFHQPAYMADSGLYYPILLTSHGERPYADFDLRYTPGLFYLNALLFDVFGVRMSVVRWGIAVFWLFDLIGLHLVARFIMPRKFALIAPAMALLWGPLNRWAPWASWYSVPPAIFSLFFTLKYAERGRTADLLLAGIAGGVTFFFKQSTGALAMVSLVVVYVVASGLHGSDSAGKSKLVLSLRILGVIFGCFLFPQVMMRHNIRSNHIAFHLLPLGTLGLLLIAIIIRTFREQGGGTGNSACFRNFIVPPALAAAAFLIVTALWFPVASEGFGAVRLMKYLLMFEKPLFVYVGARLRLTPTGLFETLAPAAFYLGLSLLGAIFFLKSKVWVRMGLALALVAAGVTVALVRPDVMDNMFSRVALTSAGMVLTLHFVALIYLIAKTLLRADGADSVRKVMPLLTVLIFSNFFFLQLFPFNSFIHLRWAINPWFVLTAWLAYGFYGWMQRADADKARSALVKGLRYAVAVVPIALYFGLTILFNLATGFFTFTVPARPVEAGGELSSAWDKIRALAHVEIHPKQLVRPDLKRVDVRIPVELAQEMQILVKYLREHTGPDDMVFGPSLNFINFAADIPSPLKENHFFLGWVGPRDEIEICQLIDVSRPKYVIFFDSGDPADAFGLRRFVIDFPNLATYLDTRYAFDVKIGPFTVARRM